MSMGTPASPLQQSAALASAGATGPSNVLATAPAASVTPDNALMEQLTNLSLPYGEQIFAPLPDRAYASDYIATTVPADLSDPYNLLPQNQPAAPASSVIAGLSLPVLAVIGLGLWLLFGQSHASGGGRAHY